MNLVSIQSWLLRLLGVGQQIVTLSARVSNLEKEVLNMLQQITDLQNAVSTFQAEVTTDLGALLTQVQSLQDQVTSLQGQTTVSAEDLAALVAMTTSLTQATSDVHAKVQVPVIPSSSSSAQ